MIYAMNQFDYIYNISLSYNFNSKSIWNYSNRKEEYLYYRLLSDRLIFLKKRKEWLTYLEGKFIRWLRTLALRVFSSKVSNAKYAIF